MRELSAKERKLVAGGDALRTGLNGDVDNFLAKSFMAQFDMGQAQGYNYRYEWTSTAGKSYRDTTNHVIYIDAKYQADASAAAAQVAHELGHAIFPWQAPTDNSRSSYQWAGYLWEAHAIEAGLAFAYDMEKQGIKIPVPSASQEAANIYVHAYAEFMNTPFVPGDFAGQYAASQKLDNAIADAVCRLEKTGNGQSYSDFYGQAWDVIQSSGGHPGNVGGIGNVSGGGFVPLGPGCGSIYPTVTVGDLLNR